MISIKVPARICFYGDHQDYLGLPVIAGTINRFIQLKAIPNTSNNFVIKLLDLKETIRITIADACENVKNGDYFRSCIAILREKDFVFERGYDIKISGNIPVNAGLSSSSALVVAWIRFLVEIQQKPISVTDKEIGHLAYKAEVEYFGQPGGLMDQYTIAQGGMLFINTSTGNSSPLNAELGTLIIAESGIAKQTIEVLNDARVYANKAIALVKKRNPNFELSSATLDDYKKYLTVVTDEFKNHWYAAIHNFNITKKAKLELQKETPDITFLGNLMNQHQQILQEKIKNTPKKMIEMMDAARNSGAYGTKIIGSGGGGCILALTDAYSKNKVVKAFIDSGAIDSYEVSLVKV